MLFQFALYYILVALFSLINTPLTQDKSKNNKTRRSTYFLAEYAHSLILKLLIFPLIFFFIYCESKSLIKFLYCPTNSKVQFLYLLLESKIFADFILCIKTLDKIIIIHHIILALVILVVMTFHEVDIGGIVLSGFVIAEIGSGTRCFYMLFPNNENMILLYKYTWNLTNILVCFLIVFCHFTIYNFLSFSVGLVLLIFIFFRQIFLYDELKIIELKSNFFL